MSDKRRFAKGEMKVPPVTDDLSSTLIVIPTLNEANHIEQTIAVLVEGYPRARLVVVDGGSTDGTCEKVNKLMATRANVKLLHNPDRYQSAGVNLAVTRFGATAQYLVRADAHAQYPAHFVSRVVASLAHNEADSLVVPMDSIGDSCMRRAIAWVSNTVVGTGGSAHRAGKKSGLVDHGHHAGFVMDSFKRIGGYDATFSHNEDAEYDCRQRATGGVVFLDADIRIGYYPRASLTSLWRQYWAYGQGRARTIQKHPSTGRPRQHVVVVNLLGMIVSLIVAIWFPLALIWPALYLSALTSTSIVATWKMKSRCGLLAGLAALTMHCSWAIGFIEGVFRFREKRWIESIPAEASVITNDRRDVRIL